MIWGIAALLLVFLMFYGNRKGQREGLAEKHLWQPFGRWLLSQGNRLLKKNEAAETDIYNTADREKLEKGLVLCWLLLFAGCLACFLYSFTLTGGQGVRELLRPEFGQEKSVALIVSGENTEEEIMVNVSGREPEEAELKEIMDHQFEKLCVECPAEGETIQEVRTNLNWYKTDDYGITYTYKSHDVLFLSDRGVICALEEELSESGTPVEVDVTLSCGDFSQEYLMEVILFPPKQERLGFRDLLEQELTEEDRRTRKEMHFQLPEQVDGKDIYFHKSEMSPGLLFLFFAAAAIFIPASIREKKKEEAAKRCEELVQSYPSFLSKIRTLLQAGMSIRNAWERIARDYQRGREDGRREKTFVYEEVLITLYQMEQGVSEGEAYVNFGRRCGVHAYLKLGNLLRQNLRQGISGLESALAEEEERAWEERKNEALKKGEEAGTKLLLPMTLLLGVVIIVVTVPAFMAM